MLSFTLLGQVVLSQDGIALSKFRSQKEAALLIYLAQTGQTQPRDFLADLLWESSSPKQGLTNLRTAISRLRKQVGDALLVTRKTVTLAPEHVDFVDTAVLQQTLTANSAIENDTQADTLQQALATYQGEFLADFSLPDTTQFSEWITITREQIHRQVIVAYDKLAQYVQAHNDTERGIIIARQWLKADPLDESAHTLLIEMLIHAGSTREALEHYTYCTQLLHSELGIAPPAAMTAFIQTIRPKRSAPPHPTTIRHNLPAAYDQFFGRKTISQEIQIRLDQPFCRLVTLTGQGGMGKTRLATTIAHSRLNQYPDGVWLIELANIDADDEDIAEAIAVEVATILDLRLTGSAKPVNQLLNHLQHKQMLLFLDNFEHLLEGGVSIVLDILQRCPKVQLLVTSREALKIRAEWTIALTGLSCPANATDEAPSDAVELFVARQAQQQHSAPSTEDLSAIRTICRMVDGLPLAIELAAALTHHTPAPTIAHNLQDGFDALTTTLRDMPQRHRGLDIVFEMSWQTLARALQDQLARLSLFRGGFTHEAAQQITQANRTQLAALIEKSLLTHNTANGRYTLHPVIRAYAAEKRTPSDPTLQSHAHYFLTLLAAHTEPIQKERPQDSIALFEPDIDNIRLAWQTGLGQQQAEWLYDALTSLSTYCQLRGLAHEGEATMKSTMNNANAWKSDGTPLATRAGLERARFQNRLGQYRPAIHTIKATLKLAKQCEDRWAIGMGHVLWSESLWRLGEYDAAQKKLTETLDFAKTIDAPLIIGWCHHHLGVIHDIQSRYDTAHNHLEEACANWRKADYLQALSNSLNSIGLVNYHKGDLPTAQHAMEQALTICEQIEDRYLQSNLVNNLSIILTEQSDYEGAQYYLQLGLNLATVSGDIYVQGAIHTNIGKNYYQLGEFNAAVKSLEKGLKIFESIGEISLTATAMFNLAETKRKLGDLEQAQILYGDVLEITQKENLQRTRCEAMIGMAELLSEKNGDQAKQYSVKAVELAEAINNPNFLERAKAIDNSISSQQL